MNNQNQTKETLFGRLMHNGSDDTYWEDIRELRRREDIVATCYNLITTGNIREKQIAVDILAQTPYAPETFRLYFELLDTVPHPDVISSVLYAIGHNNKYLTSTQTDTIAAFKSHAYKDIREALAFALLNVPHAAAIQALIVLSADKSTAVRSWAVFGIGRKCSGCAADVTAALWERMEDKDAETRNEAIVGLALRKDIRVKDVIKRELMTDHGSLLFEAIIELGDAEFLPLLESKLNDDADPAWLNALQDCITTLKGG